MYKIKKEVSVDIKKRYKQIYLAEELGMSRVYISQLLNRKLSCPKSTAFAFTKVLDLNAQIEDFFEVV